MTTRATGTFEVALLPLTADGEWGAFARLSIDKQFSGDLVAEGRGQMLAAQTAVKGSAGYVALESVTGGIEGRDGTFVLQHTGVMRRGEPGLKIGVVPDSGTGDLEGISGTMEITVDETGHCYTFDYNLPDLPAD
jgi:hypothetical protein